MHSASTPYTERVAVSDGLTVRINGYKKGEAGGCSRSVGLNDRDHECGTAAGKLRSEGAEPSPVFLSTGST